MRRLHPSEMVLPYAIAILLGLGAGFRVAPIVKGEPALARPAGVVGLAPVPSTTVPPAPAGDAANPDAPPVPQVAGLPLLVVGDGTVAAVAPKLRLATVTSPPRPTGWVQAYLSSLAVGIELMVVVDGDDPAWARVGASDETVATTAAQVQRISDGGPTRVVIEAAGHRVAVSSTGLSDDEIAAVVAGLAPRAEGGPGVDVTALPAGLRLVAQGPGALDDRSRYRLSYGVDAWFVELDVARALPLVATPAGPGEPVARLELRDLDGTVAVVSSAASGDAADGADGADDLTTVRWCRPDGLCPTLTTRGLTVERSLEVAASLRPATPDESAGIARR